MHIGIHIHIVYIYIHGYPILNPDFTMAAAPLSGNLATCSLAGWRLTPVVFHITHEKHSICIDKYDTIFNANINKHGIYAGVSCIVCLHVSVTFVNLPTELRPISTAAHLIDHVRPRPAATPQGCDDWPGANPVIGEKLLFELSWSDDTKQGQNVHSEQLSYLQATVPLALVSPLKNVRPVWLTGFLSEGSVRLP